MAVEMLGNIQSAQAGIQGELKTLGQKNASLLRNIEKVSQDVEREREMVSSLRERVAKLEGRME